MNRVRLRLGFTILVVVGAILALLSGRWVGSLIADSRKADEKVRLTGSLEKNIQGIAIGQPFPDLPVWTTDGARATPVLELLPDGGVVFCVSSICESCVDALAALMQARTQLGDIALPFVVVTSPEPARLLDGLAGRGIACTLWCDQQDLLRTRYKVLTTRAWFALDSAGVVLRFGSAEYDPAEYEDIVKPGTSHKGT